MMSLLFDGKFTREAQTSSPSQFQHMLDDLWSIKKNKAAASLYLDWTFRKASLKLSITSNS